MMRLPRQSQTAGNQRPWQRLGLAVGFLWIAGCGGSSLETAKVTGKVTLNGHPVSQGKIMFRPAKGPLAAGALGPGGRYELSTFSPGDGVIVGECAVAIAAPSYGLPMAGMPPNPPPPPPEEAIPARYHNFETSGLIRVVEEGDNVFDFELGGS